MAPLTKALPPKCKHLSSNLWHTCKRSDIVVHACNSIAGGRDRRAPIACLPDLTNQWAPGSLRDTVSNKKLDSGWGKHPMFVCWSLHTLQRDTGYVHIAYMSTWTHTHLYLLQYGWLGLRIKMKAESNIHYFLELEWMFYRTVHHIDSGWASTVGDWMK